MIQRIGDFSRIAPAETVVFAHHVKSSSVFHAVNHMNEAIFASDGHWIVHRLFFRATHVFASFALRHMRIPRKPGAHVSHVLGRRKGLSTIGAAAQMNFDFTPVSFSQFSRLAVGEDCIFGRDDDSGNTIDGVAVCFFLKQHLFIEEGFFASP